MSRFFNRRSIRYLLVVLLLVAGQSLAFAHGVDEASHPAKTVCDLCIAGYPLGAGAGGSHTVTEFPLPAQGILLVEFHPSVSSASYFTPGQRAPPLSR